VRKNLIEKRSVEMIFFVYRAGANYRAAERQLKWTIALADFAYKKNRIRNCINDCTGVVARCSAFFKMIAFTTP
jgi:hypothetical protein